MSSRKKQRLEDLLDEKTAMRLKKDVKKDIEEGKERLRNFSKYVQDHHFFLGICREEGSDHLVVTSDLPRGAVQDVVFLFPWESISFVKIFIAPDGKNRKRVFPVSEEYSILIDLVASIALFTRAVAIYEGAKSIW